MIFYQIFIKIENIPRSFQLNIGSIFKKMAKEMKFFRSIQKYIVWFMIFGWVKTSKYRIWCKYGSSDVFHLNMIRARLILVNPEIIDIRLDIQCTDSEQPVLTRLTSFTRILNFKKKSMGIVGDLRINQSNVRMVDAGNHNSELFRFNLQFLLDFLYWKQTIHLPRCY